MVFNLFLDRIWIVICFLHKILVDVRERINSTLEILYNHKDIWKIGYWGKHLFLYLTIYDQHRTSLETLRGNIYCTLIKLPFINYNYAINNNGRNAT